MTAAKTTLRICPKGHTFYKSTTCPVCPICGKEGAEEYFVPGMGAPARRALENAGIKSLNELAQWSEKELLQLHGMGPGSIPTIKSTLKTKGLSLKK